MQDSALRVGKATAINRTLHQTKLQCDHIINPLWEFNGCSIMVAPGPRQPFSITRPTRGIPVGPSANSSDHEAVLTSKM